MIKDKEDIVITEEELDIIIEWYTKKRLSLNKALEDLSPKRLTKLEYYELSS
jgi:predicted HTH domain antitoxin